MLEFLGHRRHLALIAFVVGVIAAAAVAGAQESVSPASSPGGMAEFVNAPNDSSEIAAGIQALIRKEQSGFMNRLKNSGLGVFYVKGGIFMHPLLLCSIAGLVIIIERLWTLSRARVNVKALMMKIILALREQGPQASLEVCQRTRGPIAAILHSGLLRAERGPAAVQKAIETSGAIEMSFLERGLVWLVTIANIAPLHGFLGTVSGMISAFAAIAAAEQVSAKLVARGIEEALITTLAGLCIAIPVTIAHSYFVGKIDRFVIEMEEASAELVDELMDIEKQGSGRV